MLGAKYFPKLDVTSDYWEIKVESKSSNVWTFGTAIGKFHFKQLPYGIHSTSEVFYKTVLSIISEIQGSANFQDNKVIWRKTLAGHDNRLQKVFLKVKESGLKLNKNKCQFLKESIVYLGHIISSDGIRVDPFKTGAIAKMPIPQSLFELARFLGMVNYLGKFIPNLAKVTSPLRALF